MLVNVQTWKKMDQDLLVAAVVGEAAEEAVTKEGVFATDVTGLVTSPVNVLKEMQAMREVVDLSATAVIALAILPGSVLKGKGITEDSAEVEITVEDPNATSAIGLVISRESVVKKRIVVTSVMELDILLEIVARMRILVTTVTRLAIS